MTDALTAFMAAVKANDVQRMGWLWGTERGAAAGWMNDRELMQRLTIIQRYLTHVGYRIVEGPLPGPGGNQNLRTFRVELQRPQCNTVFPMDVVRTRDGGWLVYDVHLTEVGNPRGACQPPPGTGR
jgi:hypothetical protein